MENTLRSGMSRRAFLGSAAGSAALLLLRPAPDLTGGVEGSSLLQDYVGRLCYNENPLGPSPAAVTAMSGSLELSHRYPDWYAESLRSTLAAYHGCMQSQIIAGSGATEILRLAALAFATPGSNVVCPYPSYGQFAGDAQFLGCTVRYSSLDPNYRVDLADLASLVDSNTSAVCITNPNNPTATVLSASAISDFVDSLPSGVEVIIDEAYHHYVHDVSYRSAIELVLQGKRVVVARTFSKAFGLAGARIGYAVAPGTLISAMSVWQPWGTVTRMSQEAGMAALDDTQHITDSVSLNDQAKQYCFDSFDDMQLEYIPSETNFFMVDVGGSSSGVASELAARGISVRTGWGMPRHLRVSTGTMEEMEDFITALRDILGIGIRNVGYAPEVPRVPTLFANYPNPARTATSLSYSVPAETDVSLRIYNIRGQLIKTLVNGRVRRGVHELHWDGKDDRGMVISSGSYFYRLIAGETTETRRMIWVR